MKYNLIFSIGVCIMCKQLSASTIPTFGFVPNTFPRDPVEVNQFAEHMLLGQILQPLTDTDQLGNVIPAIASRWSFDKEGKLIIFEIDKNVKFSNGENVTSRDVKYTIERHIKRKSQSSAFFRSIIKIENPSASKIIFHLKEPDVSLIKVLSRDHLGIVPFGWEFDQKSNSPYIGSGPYNLHKQEKKWILEANPYFKDVKSINIPKLELSFYTDESYSIDFKNFPDIVPLISKKNFNDYKVINPEKSSFCTSAEEMTFSQSSAWWNPKSKYFKDNKIRANTLGFLNKHFRIHSEKYSIPLATSFIPVGVMGHLKERIDINYEKPSASFKIKISSSSIAFKEIFNSSLFVEDSKKVGIEFIIQYVTAANVKKSHEEFKPDITIGSWGGGFNDPTGFIGPLEEDLGMSFEEYLGSLRKDFIKAQSTQDWSLRADIFRNIATSLVKNAYMVPGFKNEQFSCLNSLFEKKEVSLRYTPRLINYKRRSE